LHEGAIAINYKVFFVPLPFSKQLGKVHSGLFTLSPHHARQSVRYAFPGNYAWPKGVFMLDRCFLVNRYALHNDKELLVVNTHNSAYDDGSLRKLQMETLRGFLLDEYRVGNYIVVGGDWNQTPAGMMPEFQNAIFDTVDLSYIKEDFLPADWTWLYDPLVPTNRRLDIPYDPDISRTTLIDFFLISPNLEALEVKGIDLDFRFSDHQPVLATIRLKN
jgi:endonuclease/exonuclease/phosphatase family metal-dependent hydrolase